MVYRGNTLDIWDGLTNNMYSFHKLIGIIIFFLVLLRLIHRWSRGAPDHEPTLEPWQRLVSRLNHWGLYILLLVVPLLGYIGISQYPALSIFGIPLPGIVPENQPYAAVTFFVHFSLALVLVALAGLHVAAALFHYFIRKDGVLGRMLPSMRRD